MDKKILLTMALLIAAVSAANVRILTIELTAMRQGSFTLGTYGVYEGLADEPLEGEYTLELLSDSGEVLYSTGFDARFLAYPSDYAPTVEQTAHKGADLPPVEIDELTLSFNVPYSPEIASVRIVKNGVEVFSSELTLCNSNGVCEPEKAENFLSCPGDCASGSEDGLCDAVFDGKCDPDCAAQGRQDKDTDCTCGNGVCDEREDQFYCAADCGSPKNMILYGAIGAGVVVLLILALIVKKIFMKPKAKKPEHPAKHGHKKKD